ncbi:DedA family protein [Gracilimonas sp. BCB1]|uniref:DedA family protein n=1 Tax=Gracilimonas sp. BCB1 TaxID=3152362 RepID=UPI0032D99062
MKLIHFCIFLIFGVATSVNAFAIPKHADVFVYQEFGVSDTTEQLSETENINKDSLQKLVPYLDNVEADSENELLVLYMLLIILATFMSEDLACIGAGLMAAQGLIDFWPAAIAATAGIYIGDFTLYFAGRLMGNAIFNIPPFKWMVKKENAYSAEAWFQKKGPVILVLSRFIPGSRFPVYLSAGILKTGFWTFLLYFGLTALLWTPTFVWLSVFAGNELLFFYEAYEEYAVWAALAVFIFIIVLLKYLIPVLKKKFEI